MYSATKIFCEYMTQGLKQELKDNNIDVLGIRSFGLSPTAEDEEFSWYKVFFEVTAE